MSEARMVVARGPNGELVNILDNADFAKWHRRTVGGLTCLSYGHPVTVKLRRDTGTRYLSHNSGGGEGQDKRELGESRYMKLLLSAWLKQKLTDQGFDAREVDDDIRFDLLVVYQGRRVAIRIERNVSSVDPETDHARQREINQQIRAEGYTPLWITDHTRWDDSIRAIGIKQYESPRPPRFRISKVLGHTIGIDQGVLTIPKTEFASASPQLRHMKHESVPLEELIPDIITGRYIYSRFDELRGFVSSESLRSYSRALRASVDRLNSRVQEAEEANARLDRELGNAQTRNDYLNRQIEAERLSSGRQAETLSDTQSQLKRATDWAVGVEDLRDRNLIARTVLQRTPVLFENSIALQPNAWQVLWPKLMMIGLLVFAFVIPIWMERVIVLPEPWKLACQTIVAALLLAGGAWLAWGWCWAAVPGSQARCRTRRARVFSRCGHQRTHSLNAFDLLGALALAGTILTTWYASALLGGIEKWLPA